MSSIKCQILVYSTHYANKMILICTIRLEMLDLCACGLQKSISTIIDGVQIVQSGRKVEVESTFESHSTVVLHFIRFRFSILEYTFISAPDEFNDFEWEYQAHITNMRKRMLIFRISSWYFGHTLALFVLKHSSNMDDYSKCAPKRMMRKAAHLLFFLSIFIFLFYSSIPFDNLWNRF